MEQKLKWVGVLRVFFPWLCSSTICFLYIGLPKLFIDEGYDLIDCFSLFIHFVGKNGFVDASFAFGPMPAGKTREQVFVIVVFFAMTITKLAIENLWDLHCRPIGLRYFAGEKGRG